MTFLKPKTKIARLATDSEYAGADIESLMAILETKRPHKSKAEKKFISNFILPLGVESDGFGNLFKRIQGVGDSILWSVHTDTVHNSGGRQAIQKRKGIISLSPRGKSNCLGADDGAGIWLAREMILAGKPGLYVFHRAEECGGLGSDFIATHGQELLDGIQIAIALDRKGYNDVITHQGGRGCSDTFAESLCDALGMEYMPDDTGLFTDTANYFDLIPECTNISVGYFGQHSKSEYLDSEFLISLRHALINLDTSKLIVERNPEESRWTEEQDSQDDLEKFFSGDLNDRTGAESDYIWRKDSYDDDSDIAHIIRACYEHPEIIAQLISEYGIGLDEILQEIYDKTGRMPN
jgi:hypothetical protein